MTSFVLSVNGQKPITGDLQLESVSTPSVRQFYRAPHDPERVNVDKPDFRYIPNTGLAIARGRVRSVVITKHKSMPEVYRFKPFHSVILTSALQWLWKNINPEIDGEKWATLVTDGLMLTNQTGFGGSDPRADYVNGKNLSAKPPAFDQVRFMGGAIFMVVEQSNLAMVETIRTDRPLPTAEQVLNSPWLWYWGTGIRPDGGVNYIQRMGIDGTMKRVKIPLYTSQQVYLPLSELHKLPLGAPVPEPNWQYF